MRRPQAARMRVTVRLFARLHAMVVARYPESPPRRVLYETIRRMVDHLVTDVITQSQKNIVASSVDSIQAVRGYSRPLISLRGVSSGSFVMPVTSGTVGIMGTYTATVWSSAAPIRRPVRSTPR